jgi:hypothetical protein
MQDVQEIFRRSLGFSELRNSHIFKARMAQVLSANTVALQDQTTAVNDTVLVPVNVQEAFNVESFTFDFTFDSSRLEFAGIRTAGTMTDNYLVFGDTVSDGRASIIGTTLSSPVSGSGTFLYVELKALAEGNASVNLDNLLADLQGATTQGAVITVEAGSGATPTPTATPVDGDFSLLLGSTTLRAGETGMVEVLLTGLTAPVDTFTFDFVFDSDLLSFVSASKVNTLSDNAAVGSNLVSDGRVTITGVSPIAIQEDGVLLVIHIQAKADAEGSALISLESVKADLQDAIPGSNVVDIQAGVPGDTDGDGMVDALDVLLFSQFWMTSQDSDSARSDVNNDLVIDQFDLLQLSEYWK